MKEEWRKDNDIVVPPSSLPSFILLEISAMLWLILGCTIPSMIVCWAAGFAVRRWGPRLGLVDRPGHRKIHETPMPTSGGLAIWLGIVLPLLAGQIVLWGLDRRQAHWSADRQAPLLRRPESPAATFSADVRRAARSGPAAPVGQALGTAGRRHGADAAGTGRRSPRPGLAAAAGRADRSWPWRWFASAGG